jgi:5-bromo-4-chloroindolyl phosphate hydrolysis protein
MSDETAKDGLLSGILASAIFLVFLLAIDAGLILSLLVAAVAYAIGFFFFFKVKRPEIIAGESTLKAALLEGGRKLAVIQGLEKRIRKSSMVSQVKDIEGIIGKILAKIERDPGRLRQAHQFLTYYLDSTINILNKYVELGAQNVDDEDIQKALAKVESMLQTIRDAFEKQLARLLSDDAMDLDAELATLEQTIKMEGLGKE